MSEPLSAAHEAAIRERVASVASILPAPSVTFRLHQDGNAMIGGWTDTATDTDIGNVERFLECAPQDLAALLAEVDRLTAKPAGRVAGRVPRVATWGPMRYRSGGMALRGNGRILGSYDDRGVTFRAAPGWGCPSAHFATEPEARAFIEAEAVRRGWEVQS